MSLIVWIVSVIVLLAIAGVFTAMVVSARRADRTNAESPLLGVVSPILSDTRKKKRRRLFR